MHCRQCRLNENGASVIIGTLMLILVVVIGATAIALMMSTASKEEMNRQTHQNAVKNENLEINGIRLVNSTINQTSWQYVNFEIMNRDINDATVTTIGLYDEITKRFQYPENLSAGSLYPTALYCLTQAAIYVYPYADGNSTLLKIPGKKSLSVSINLSNFTNPMLISKEDEVLIRLDTLLLNTFEKRFIPPTPMMKITVESEDLGVTRRDYLLLDGTGSTDDGSITTWNWTVKDGGPALYYEGKKVQVRLASSGPFTVNLTVTDDTQMKSTSQDYTIPKNPQFNPPTSLTINTTLPLIIAHIASIDNSNVSFAPIDFLLDANPFGNITLSKYTTITDSEGNANTTVLTGLGRIKVVSGNLPPAYVLVP